MSKAAADTLQRAYGLYRIADGVRRPLRRVVDEAQPPGDGFPERGAAVLEAAVLDRLLPREPASGTAAFEHPNVRDAVRAALESAKDKTAAGLLPVVVGIIGEAVGLLRQVAHDLGLAVRLTENEYRQLHSEVLPEELDSWLAEIPTLDVDKGWQRVIRFREAARLRLAIGQEDSGAAAAPSSLVPPIAAGFEKRADPSTSAQTHTTPQPPKQPWIQADVDTAIREYKTKLARSYGDLVAAVAAGRRGAKKDARKLYGRNKIAEHLGCPSAMVSKSPAWRAIAAELDLGGRKPGVGRGERVGFAKAAEQVVVAKHTSDKRERDAEETRDAELKQLIADQRADEERHKIRQRP